MNCNIIKDLIPLYMDKCCSEESLLEVEEHIKSCESCKTYYENMSKWNESHIQSSEAKHPPITNKINLWKASLLQSFLMFISFGIITIGVFFEASTPSGSTNGDWAFNLVVPATGFMLSLVNWYFIRLYSSTKKFCFFSFITTVIITTVAYIWARIHYEFPLFADVNAALGLILTLFLSIVSTLASYKYAKLSGKD